MKTKGMQKDPILISPEHKKALAKEFNTSKTSIQASLNYFVKSPLAKKIRKRAKELLIEEANKIEEETPKTEL